MSTKIKKKIQELRPGDQIELFILDLTAIGEPGVVRFTNSIAPEAGVQGLYFGGMLFNAVDFESEGWEYNGVGPFPRPKLSVSNVKSFLSDLLYEHQDLVGCKVTRIETFAEFLDGMPGADAEVMLPPDIFQIFRKTKHNKTVVEFELSALVDEENIKLPSRKILRDTCTHTYRMLGSSGWDYSQATCPYSGSAYFKEDGTPTGNAAQDKCGYQLRDCKLRFGNQNLPTRAFPGVFKVKI